MRGGRLGWCRWDKVWLWTGSNFICNKPTQHANAKTKTIFVLCKRCVVSIPAYLLGTHTVGDISSELYGDWLWDENFKFCLIFTHFSRFSPFSGYIWWNNTLSSLENFSLNSILFFLFLMSHPDNGGFLKIAQKRDSISKKTSFCIMVINTDHQESWFLSVGHPLCALR